MPISRRYEPGTLVIETTWVTDTGWVVVHDLLSIAEWATATATASRPADRPRVRPLAAAAGDLHRRRGRDGDGVPAALRLRRRGGELERRRAGRSDGPRQRRHRAAPDQRHGADDRRAAPPAARLQAARGRDRLLRGHLGRRRARRPAQRPRGAGAARLDRRVLARVAARRRLPRPPLAHPPAALGAGAEGPHLHADRRDRRRPDHLAARDPRRRTQLGLPLQLDPRLDLQPLGAAHARLRPGGARLHALHPRRLQGQPRPADHVRDRRRAGADREHARPPRRLRRRPPGADRQRRLRPAPERRLGRPARLDLPARKGAARARHAGRPAADPLPGRSGDRGLARTPTRGSGSRAASPSTTSPRS